MSHSQPLAYSLPAHEPSSEDLRRTLRDIPLLPAPANVDDLLARFEGSVEALRSPALAAMIQDARAAEPPVHWEDEEDDSFFPPVASAANANAASLSRPMRVRPRRLVALAGAVSAALFVLAQVWWPDPVQPAPSPEAMLILPELAPTALAAPELPFERMTTVAEAPKADEPIIDRDLDVVEEAVAAAVSDGLAASAVEPVDPVPIEEPAAAFDAEAGADGGEEPAEADLSAQQAGDLAQDPGDAAAGVENEVNAPLPPSRPALARSGSFRGVWATSARACTPEAQRQGALPATITATRARAGATTCSFKRVMRRGEGWSIAAECSNGRSSWRSTVRLALKNGRLIWSSRRGTASYVRCS